MISLNVQPWYCWDGSATTNTADNQQEILSCEIFHIESKITSNFEAHKEESSIILWLWFQFWTRTRWTHLNYQGCCTLKQGTQNFNEVEYLRYLKQGRCQECDFHATTHSVLKDHMRSSHVKVKPSLQKNQDDKKLLKPLPNRLLNVKFVTFLRNVSMNSLNTLWADMTTSITLSFLIVKCVTMLPKS